VLYAPKLYTLRYLINPLGMVATSNQILFAGRRLTGGCRDRLGNDWAGKLPAEY
jgi:hypothetical protein